MELAFGTDPTAIFFRVIFPPLFYALHGWFATAMAIWALFHPYHAWYFPFTRWQIPCTPGIFPKRRSTLAQAVASTITDTLLTTDDIKGQAQTLVTEDNVYLAVDGFVEACLKEFRNISQLHRLASDISEFSPMILHQLVLSIIDGVERGSDRRIGGMLEKVFDQLVLSVRISGEQADELSRHIMDSIVTPDNVRQLFISLLSPQNINALDEAIQKHASGPYRLLARIIGVKRVCYESRNFMEKEPAESLKLIVDLLKRFEIREQLAAKISQISLRSMPLEQINAWRDSFVSFCLAFLVEHRQDILLSVERIQGEAVGTVQNAIIRFNPSAISPSILDKAKRDVSKFLYSYLHREMGELLERAIPALGVHGLIAHKINEFSPQKLEEVIKRICREELKWLEFLGGFIGFWLGLVQVFLNVVFH